VQGREGEDEPEKASARIFHGLEKAFSEHGVNLVRRGAGLEVLKRMDRPKPSPGQGEQEDLPIAQT
jgi:hypothetical protein